MGGIRGAHSRRTLPLYEHVIYMQRRVRANGQGIGVPVIQQVQVTYGAHVVSCVNATSSNNHLSQYKFNLSGRSNVSDSW